MIPSTTMQRADRHSDTEIQDISFEERCTCPRGHFCGWHPIFKKIILGNDHKQGGILFHLPVNEFKL